LLIASFFITNTMTYCLFHKSRGDRLSHLPIKLLERKSIKSYKSIQQPIHLLAHFSCFLLCISQGFITFTTHVTLQVHKSIAFRCTWSERITQSEWGNHKWPPTKQCQYNFYQCNQPTKPTTNKPKHVLCIYRYICTHIFWFLPNLCKFSSIHFWFWHIGWVACLLQLVTIYISDTNGLSYLIHIHYYTYRFPKAPHIHLSLLSYTREHTVCIHPMNLVLTMMKIL